MSRVRAGHNHEPVTKTVLGAKSAPTLGSRAPSNPVGCRTVSVWQPLLRELPVVCPQRFTFVSFRMVIVGSP